MGFDGFLGGFEKRVTGATDSDTAAEQDQRHPVDHGCPALQIIHTAGGHVGVFMDWFVDVGDTMGIFLDKTLYFHGIVGVIILNLLLQGVGRSYSTAPQFRHYISR